MKRDEILKTVLPEVTKYYLIEMKKNVDNTQQQQSNTQQHDKYALLISDLAARITHYLGEYYEEDLE